MPLRYIGYEKLMGVAFGLNLLLAAIFGFCAGGLNGMASLFGGGTFVAAFVVSCLVGAIVWKIASENASENTSKQKIHRTSLITFIVVMAIGLLLCLFHGGVSGFGHLLFTVVMATLAVLVEVEALERL